MMNVPSELAISSAAYHHVQHAMAKAFDSMVVDEPLVPLTMRWLEDEVRVEQFMAGTYDDSIAQAMRSVESRVDAATAYAVVWSGYINVNGRRSEAVVLELALRQEPCAHQLAQSYAVTDDGDKVVLRGDIMGLGTAPSLFHHQLSVLNMSEHLLKPEGVTSDAHLVAVMAQPFAQIPAALICLAANLFEGSEAERASAGIRTLQNLERDAKGQLCRHVLKMTVAAVAGGDLATVLPADTIEGLTKVLVEGAQQLKFLIQKGLVQESDARDYLATVRRIVASVVGCDGTPEAARRGERLIGIFDAIARLS